MDGLKRVTTFQLSPIALGGTWKVKSLFFNGYYLEFMGSNDFFFLALEVVWKI